MDYDVSDLVLLCSGLALDWDGEARWRARMPFSPHKDSRTLFIRKQPSDRPRDVLDQLQCGWTELGQLTPLRDALLALEEHRGQGLARAMLVSLQAGGLITRHRDTGRYAEATDRFHLPVRTNDKAIFAFWPDALCSALTLHMGVGAWYSFNKHIEHAARNDGAEERIHLIADLWKPDHVGPVPV